MNNTLCIYSFISYVTLALKNVFCIDISILSDKSLLS